MPRLPAAILFDLDDTIIEAYSRPQLAWAAVVGEFTHRLGDAPPDVIVAAIAASANDFWGRDQDWHRIWRQRLREAREQIVETGFAQLASDGYAVPPVAVQHALSHRFSAYREENLKLFPDVHETIDALKARGVKLALITNGPSEQQREKVVRFALAERFDHIQIEGEHGFGKPEERAYRHALAALGVEPHEAWIVGDNLEWEVVAPQRLGIFSIWYDPHGAGVPAGHAAKPDRIIRTLTELLG
jgi:putative hydrolase of the HAD superfamily